MKDGLKGVVVGFASFKGCWLWVGKVVLRGC